MKRIEKIFLVLLLAGMACSFGGRITARQPEMTPLEASITEDAEDLTGPRIGHQGIHFSLDPTLGSQVFVFEQPITSQSGLTAHSILFSLTPEDSCESWCLIVYPVSEFEEAFGTFVFPPASYGGGSAVIFNVHEKQLDFQNGSGERALQAFGQMEYFIGQDALKYAYRGISTDGKTAVYLQVPVQADGLFFPTPTLPVSGDVFEGIDAHNRQLALSLNSLDPSALKPNLNILDSLVTSIRIDR